MDALLGIGKSPGISCVSVVSVVVCCLLFGGVPHHKDCKIFRYILRSPNFGNTTMHRDKEYTLLLFGSLVSWVPVLHPSILPHKVPLS